MKLIVAIALIIILIIMGTILTVELKSIHVGESLFTFLPS